MRCSATAMNVGSTCHHIHCMTQCISIMYLHINIIQRAIYKYSCISASADLPQSLRVLWGFCDLLAAPVNATVFVFFVSLCCGQMYPDSYDVSTQMSAHAHTQAYTWGHSSTIHAQAPKTQRRPSCYHTSVNSCL